MSRFSRSSDVRCSPIRLVTRSSRSASSSEDRSSKVRSCRALIAGRSSGSAESRSSICASAVWMRGLAAGAGAAAGGGAVAGGSILWVWVVECSARWVWVVDSGTAPFVAGAGAAAAGPGRLPVASPGGRESDPRSMLTVSELIWSSAATARDSGSSAALIWAISRRLRVRVPILRSSSSSRASRPRPARHSRPIRSRRTPSSWPDCASCASSCARTSRYF